MKHGAGRALDAGSSGGLRQLGLSGWVFPLEAYGLKNPARGFPVEPFDGAVGMEGVEALVVVVLRQLDNHHPLGVNQAGETSAEIGVGRVAV